MYVFATFPNLIIEHINTITSELLHRNFPYSNRDYILYIVDNDGRNVLRVSVKLLFK